MSRTDMLRGIRKHRCCKGRALEIDPLGIFLGALIIGAQGLSIWFFFWIWKTKRKSAARGEGRLRVAALKNGEVRVLATFTGLRGLPWVALASNSLNPVFSIESQQLVFRVIRRQRRTYADLLEVDVREAYGTFNLIFSFRGTPLTFVANVGTAVLGAHALAQLPSGVQLSDRARSALQTLQTSPLSGTAAR